MTYCQNCGRQIKSNTKYCCETCRFTHHRKTAELTNPPDFTHCQNPGCGKELDHWIKTTRKNGDVFFKYYSKQKYCDRKCSGDHKKIYMVGRKRPEITNSWKKKRKAKMTLPDEKERSQDYSCDPFACQDVYLDG